MPELEAAITRPPDDVGDVFVSYAHEDTDRVRPNVAALRDVGVKVFDASDSQSLMWGQDLESYLEALFPIRVRSAMLFLSASYANSKYCATELAVIAKRAADASTEALILPVRLDDTPLPESLERFVCLDSRGLSSLEFAEKTKKALDHWDDSHGSTIRAMSDESLVNHIRVNRDDRAFAVLYERYYPTILKSIHGLLGPGLVDVDDVAQATILRLWQGMDRFDPKTQSVRAWISRVTRNVGMNHLRDYHRSWSHMDDWDVHTEPEHSDLYKLINRAIQELSPAEQEMIKLLFLDGLTVREAADRLGASQAITSKRYHRTLQRLRNLISHNIKKGRGEE